MCVYYMLKYYGTLSMYHSNKLDKFTNKEIKQWSHATLSPHGIQFFDYARMYDDGSCSIVSNNEQIIKYLFEKRAPLFAPIAAKLLKNKFYYLIPEAGDYQKVMHDVKQHFDLAHCFDLFEVHDGYVDVCCFGSTANNQSIINYYINNIDQLEKFYANFKEQTASIMATTTNNKLILPTSMQLNFNSKMLNQPTKQLLTNRQLQCLRLLINGQTAKQISEKLHLSIRTVEHYLEAIKHKLDCHSRAELIIKAVNELRLN